KDPEEVERLVYEELERVKNQPVTDAELQKIRMEVKRGKVEQLEGTLFRAQALGENAIFYNDPNVINTGNDKLMSVTKEQIQKVALPKPSEATLSNGLTVLIMENHRLPVISLQFNLSGAGPIFDAANLPGLAGITAQMLREGTKTRSSLQIAEQMDQLGASISASAPFGDPATVINASGLSDNFEQWFVLTNDLLLNPTFPGDELNRLKQRVKTQP